MSVVAAKLLALLMGTTAWLVPVAAPGPVQPVATGWWWRLQQGGLPAPPTVPDDGIAVAMLPDGPSMVSAIKLRRDTATALPVRIELDAVHELGVTQGAAVACPADASWAPARAGAWSERVRAFCDLGMVPLKRDEARPKWIADISPLLDVGKTVGSGEAVSIAILPAVVALGPDPIPPAPFELDFAAPTLSATANRGALDESAEPAPVLVARAPAAPGISALLGAESVIRLIPAEASVGSTVASTVAVPAPESAPGPGDVLPGVLGWPAFGLVATAVLLYTRRRTASAMALAQRLQAPTREEP